MAIYITNPPIQSMLSIERRIYDTRLEQPEYAMHYATDGSAAFDVRACIETDINLRSGESVWIPLGFSVHIKNPGYCAMLLPRSGFGGRGLVLGNVIGLIDSDYTGPVVALAWNRNRPGHPPILIQPMAKIAQMTFLPVIRAEFVDVPAHAFTERGENGRGSTGDI